GAAAPAPRGGPPPARGAPGAPVPAVPDGPVFEIPSVSCPGWSVGSDPPRPAPADPGAPVPCGRPTPNRLPGYSPGSAVTSPLLLVPAACGAPAPETMPPPSGW